VWRIVFFVEFLYRDSENFLGEGGDVEQVARSSKYVLVFVFGSLSTLFISCIDIINHLYMLDIVPALTLI